MPKQILYLGLDPSHNQNLGEITHWPIIRILPRPFTDPSVCQSLIEFDHYSHLLITSKSTVAILQNYLPLAGISLHQWKKKITLAIGQITAKHLQNCGIHPQIIAQEETAEGLIDELKKMSLAKESSFVFWPHSSQARPIIKEYLISHQIPHRTCVLYEPQPQIPKELPNLDHFDEIIFTSPSTIDAFLKIFGKFPFHACLTPIGPITAKHLNKWIQICTKG